MQVIVADSIVAASHLEAWPASAASTDREQLDRRRDPNCGDAIFSPSHSYSCHNLEVRFKRPFVAFLLGQMLSRNFEVPRGAADSR
jgi:hypothetical protein